MNTFEQVLRMNSGYANDTTKNLFGIADKKKIQSKFVKKHLKANANFGAMILAQAILVNHYKGNYETVDEMIGDLQIILKETHNAIRKGINLEVNEYTIEQIMKECEATKKGNKSEIF